MSKKRKKKVVAPKEFVVPERVQKPMKSIDKLAWQFSKIMTKMRPDREQVNKKVYCEDCEQAFCLGFDGVDCFCRDCFYKNYCLKELTAKRRCQSCEK